MNELVANAIKYAFSDRKNTEETIGVYLSKLADNEILLTIEDNGVGLPSDFSLEQVRSLGLQLVYNLVNQLGGKIIVNRDFGTEFKIYFPQFSNN